MKNIQNIDPNGHYAVIATQDESGWWVPRTFNTSQEFEEEVSVLLGIEKTDDIISYWDDFYSCSWDDITKCISNVQMIEDYILGRYKHIGNEEPLHPNEILLCGAGRLLRIELPEEEEYENA